MNNYKKYICIFIVAFLIAVPCTFISTNFMISKAKYGLKKSAGLPAIADRPTGSETYGWPLSACIVPTGGMPSPYDECNYDINYSNLTINYLFFFAISSLTICIMATIYNKVSPKLKKSK